MKLEVGKQYRTRSGYQVWCIFETQRHGSGILRDHAPLFLVSHTPPKSEFPDIAYHEENGTLCLAFRWRRGKHEIVYREEMNEPVFFLSRYVDDRNDAKGAAVQAWYKENKDDIAEDIVAEWKK